MVDHTAEGSIQIGGCANYVFAIFYVSQFSVGDIVYTRHKALKGIWEKVVIKKIKVCNEADPWLLYQDTMNSLHNENDLLSYDDASEYIEIALAEQAAQAEEFALKCR